MYETFYGLSDDPFRLSPAASQCFEHSSFKKARAYVNYALHRRDGILLLTGMPGTGKTSLIRECHKEHQGVDAWFAEIGNSRIDADGLVYLVLLQFGLDPAGKSKAQQLIALQERLIDLNQGGMRPVLVIDEAQGMPVETLEEARCLTNSYTNANESLLQLFLVGQPALENVIRSPGLEQLLQRISGAAVLYPLSEEDVPKYIKHRLDCCTWTRRPDIEEEVFNSIFAHSVGIPRRINLICSRLLLRGMVQDSLRIETSDLTNVLSDLRSEGLHATEIVESTI